MFLGDSKAVYMTGKLSKLKPGVSSNVHLFVAASVWTVIGMLLISRGVIWLNGIDRLWIVFPAIILGSLKAFFVLDRSARKIVSRIVKSRDGKCIGGVYSIKTWLLVILMMLGGCLLRNSGLPKEFLGLFYVTIGWGLLLSSRNAWISWYRKHVTAQKY